MDETNERRGRRLPGGTVTFLFSDVEGSTRLLQALGDRYGELLEQHGRLMRDAICRYGGSEVSTEGDSFFAVFPSASGAMRAAVEAQRKLAAARWPDDATVLVRMGLHTGEARFGGDNYVGLDVHRAARISGAGHGGEVLLSEATKALLGGALPDGVTLRDLGQHRLRDLDAPERLYRLVIDRLRADFPPPRSVEVGEAHLPARATSFVGREHDLNELRRVLAENRLITLVGPGGTGKTSLASEIARQVAMDFRDGAWFVDLAPLADPDLVGPTIARSLGLTEQRERSIIEVLKAYVEHRAMLLVLDNFEHLLPAAHVLDELLRSAPALKALVTSRHVLELYGEQVFAVTPLSLPEAGPHRDMDRLARSEAVALFVERARAANPAFALTDVTAQPVAEICIRLDGLPLAIELAASRVRLLEPAEILARLDRSLQLLTTGASNLSARQQTLRGAIDWSYELLGRPAQVAFARLAIFAGGWTLEAAEAICNPAGELGLHTLDLMAALVDHSLVRRDGEAGESRFGMLEVIRQYGRDHLAAEGVLDLIERRHLAYYRELAEAAEPSFTGPDQARSLASFEREHANVRAALRRAVESGDSENGLRLAGATWRFWLQRGYLREGRSWLDALLDLPGDAQPATRAKAYTAAGGLAYWLSDDEATERAYEAAARLYEEMGDAMAAAEAAYNLAFVPVMRGDAAEARRRFEASLALGERAGRRDVIAQSQMSLGTAALLAGDPRTALGLYEEALAFFRKVGDQFHLQWALGEVARARARLGQRQSARLAYREALQLNSDSGNLPGIGASLEQVASLQSAAGRHAEAMRLMGAAGALRATTGAAPPLMLMGLGDLEGDARKAIGDEAVAQALAEGRAMSADAAIAYAFGLAE